MACDTFAGLCVYPMATACEVGIGEDGGPCGQYGECGDGLQCQFFGSSATICAAPCVADAQCDSVACTEAIPICPVSGFCANWCQSDAECINGQTCTPSGCMWPSL